MKKMANLLNYCQVVHVLLKFVLRVANNQFSGKFNKGWKQIKMTDLFLFR